MQHESGRERDTVCVVIIRWFVHCLVHSEANARRIAIVEQCFGNNGLVSVNDPYHVEDCLFNTYVSLT